MIDARGRSCPEPVIMIKKAMETKAKEYEMMVDSEASFENVTRYAHANGYEVDAAQNGGEYTLRIFKKQ